MTLLELMASAPLPARQPVAGQVLEVTACFLMAKRFQNAVSSSKGGRSLCPWPYQGLPAGISCHLQPGQGLLHGAGVSECSVATSIFMFRGSELKSSPKRSRGWGLVSLIIFCKPGVRSE